MQRTKQSLIEEKKREAASTEKASAPKIKRQKNFLKHIYTTRDDLIGYLKQRYIKLFFHKTYVRSYLPNLNDRLAHKEVGTH